jgi:hypothetical protein
VAAADECAPNDPEEVSMIEREHQIARWLRPIACGSALAAALLIPSIAAATGPTWWFQKSSMRIGVRPVAGVPSVIADEELGGQRWIAVGFIGHLGDGNGNFYPPSVCVAVLPGSVGNRGSTGCGLRLSANPRQTNQWLTYQDSTARPLVVGAVASGVARVVAVLKKAGTTKTTTVDVPLKPIAAVGRGIRFFVFTHQGFKVHAINVYDGSGKLLQHSLENPPKPKHP